MISLVGLVYRCFVVTIAGPSALGIPIVYYDTYYTFKKFPFLITPFIFPEYPGNAAHICTTLPEVP